MDRARGAATLKALRHRRGLSLSACARALLDQARVLGQMQGSLPTVAGAQRSIARWESNTRPTLPGERHQLLLAYLYARTSTGAPALGPGSQFAELLEALAHLGAGTAQLRLLRETVTRTVTGTCPTAMLSPVMHTALTSALADPTRMDEELPTHLAATVTDIEEHLDALPFARLQLLLVPVVDATRRLLASPLPRPVVPCLRSAAVRALTLAGRLAFETRDDDAAHALFAQATREAGLLAQPWRRAQVHLDHAFIALHRPHGLEHARRLAEAAVRDAASGTSTAVRGWAGGWQAALAARAHEHRSAHAALRIAERHTATTPDLSGTAFNPGHATGFQAACGVYIDCPRTAYDHYTAFLQAPDRHLDQAQRAVIAHHQATALLRLNDPQAAAQALHHYLDTAPATIFSRVAAVRIHQARDALRPWRGERFLTNLDDHLIETLRH
ncbi:hypothetical protein ACPCTO_37230 [Streptomyces olivoreticuli]